MIWTKSTGGVMIMPTKNITKKAGPSPESALLKSAPQAEQDGANPRYELKTGPFPHLGQRQRRPADIGETSLVIALMPEDEVRQHVNEGE